MAERYHSPHTPRRAEGHPRISSQTTSSPRQRKTSLPPRTCSRREPVNHPVYMQDNGGGLVQNPTFKSCALAPSSFQLQFPSPKSESEIEPRLNFMTSRTRSGRCRVLQHQRPHHVPEKTLKHFFSRW